MNSFINVTAASRARAYAGPYQAPTMELLRKQLTAAINSFRLPLALLAKKLH